MTSRSQAERIWRTKRATDWGSPQVSGASWVDCSRTRATWYRRSSRARTPDRSRRSQLALHLGLLALAVGVVRRMPRRNGAEQRRNKAGRRPRIESSALRGASNEVEGHVDGNDAARERGTSAENGGGLDGIGVGSGKRGDSRRGRPRRTAASCRPSDLRVADRSVLIPGMGRSFSCWACVARPRR